MDRQNCNNRNECLIIAIASSVVIGIVSAVLTITGIITVTPAFLWVVFAIAVIYLLTAYIISSLRRYDTPRCSKSIISAFIGGIMGAILISVILLGITFPATSALGAVLVGLLLLSLSLIITTISCLVLGNLTNDN